MNAARAAVEKQKKEIARLQELLKEAEGAMGGLEEKVEESVKVVQEKKDEGIFIIILFLLFLLLGYMGFKGNDENTNNQKYQSSL